MKKGIGNLIIVIASIALIVVFAIYSIGRRNNAEEENRRVENMIANAPVYEDPKKEFSYFILYEGLEMKIAHTRQALTHMPLTEENKTKYNIEYFNYEDGKKSKEKGNFGEETYEGVSIVQDVDGFSISEDYDAMPRKAKKLKKLPENFKLKLDYTDIDVVEIDLDGDEKNEYIVCYEVEDKSQEIAKSEVLLFDSEFKQIASLVELPSGIYMNMEVRFIEIDDVHFIDIDKNGIMEIIVDEPTYEGELLDVYEYSNGNLKGPINTKATVAP